MYLNSIFIVDAYDATVHLLLLQILLLCCVLLLNI